MKLNKKLIGLIAGLACVIVLIVLMLTMCSGNGDHQEDLPQNPQATEDTTVTTEEATEATTEATEETTEATEETTAPTTGGNSTPGGTSGYVPDSGSDDEDDEDEGSSGPTVENAPAAGSENSPYVEQISKFPEEAASVSIPANGSQNYLIYGAEGGVLTIEDADAYVIYQGKTYEPDEYGIVSVAISAEETKSKTAAAAETEEGDTAQSAVVLPQAIKIGSKSAAAKSFRMLFHAPLGDARNPEVVEAVDGVISMEAHLEAGDSDGYTFSYTPEKTCRLLLQVTSATENVPYDIIVTVGEVEKKLSEPEAQEEETVTLTGGEEAAAAEASAASVEEEAAPVTQEETSPAVEETRQEKILAVDLTAEETALIRIVALPAADGTYPALDIAVLGRIEDTSGTKENPILVPGEFPIVTDVMKPQTEVYYSVYGAGGMILTVEDPDAYVVIGEEKLTAVDGVVTAEVVSTNPREPVLIGIGNGGEEEKSFTVNFAFKPGHMMNPAQLLLDETNTAVIAAGSTDGYWFTWTAENEGILTLTLPDGNWMYLINNDTALVYGEAQYSNAEDASSIVETEVAAGDVLSIMISTFDPENPYELPAGEVAVYAFFTTKAGTKDNPMGLFDMETTVQIGAGEAMYFNQMMSGVDMTVSGADPFTVTYGGVNYASSGGIVTIRDLSASRFQPVSMIVTNYGSEESDYVITFTYPEGTSENPKLLELMGQYTVPAKGDGAGYFFTWTPNADGEFTLSVQGDDWFYVVNNLTTGSYGDSVSSDEGGNPTLTIPVVAGETYQINVNTANGEKKDLVLVFDFYDPTYGTRENPVTLSGMENTVTVRPGAVLYGNVTLSNVTMTVTGPDPFTVTFKGIDYVSEDGIVTVHGVDGTRWTPLLLELTNLSESNAEYTVSYAYPLGSSMNPHVITEMADYTVSVVGDGEGYFFTWIAPEDGVFTVSMVGDDWICTVNNMTGYVYGDIQTSTDGMAEQIIQVAAGDEIQVNIGTATRQNKDVTVVFDSYDPTVGNEENPLWLTELDNTLTVRPGMPLYCNVGQNGTTMTVAGAVAVTLDGVTYPAVDGVVTVPNIKASKRMPAKLILTASGDEKVTCTVSFVYPVGTMENPEVLTELGVYNAAVSDDGMGYFYSWTAQEDGKFTVTMLGDDWIYITQTRSGDEYHYGANNYSNFGDPASTALDVKAGDIVTVNIGTASGTEMAVPVVFTFQETEEVQKVKAFEGTYVPESFEILPEDIREMEQLDLTKVYSLSASVAGIYRLEDWEDSLLVLDFTDDTYVNLSKLVESTELFVPVETEDGVEYQCCNELLQSYIDNAWIWEISQEKTRTLYPLTEELEWILKSLADQYGWFNPESEGYLFLVEAEGEEEPTPLEEDSLWLFSCHYIRFVMEEASSVAEETVTEVE